MCGCEHHFDKNAACTCRCGTCDPPVDPEGEGGCPCDRCGKHHPATTCAELEDKDDLYVEPEPLKEDDAVLLWARVVDAKPDSDGEVEVSLRRADGYQTSYATTYTLPDAIVRPDAGQVPPWVKPARCTSLLMVDKTTNLRQCTRDGQQAHTIHQDSRGTTWVTAAEYGRVEVSS